MLCMITWEFTDNSESGDKRGLGIFAAWEPPKGFEIQSFYGYADGTGGAAVVEVDSAMTIANALAPFTYRTRFTVKPIVPIEEAVAALSEAISFRESVA